ncbi:MAG: preprotein translocase subunit YajC [Planctomycetota bacterium]
MTILLPLLARIAQGAPGEAAATDAPAGNPLTGFLPFLIIIAIFYFLVIRPESKKRKNQQTMLSALEKGDKVLTSSGFYAQVVQVQDDLLTLQLADGVRVKAVRWAVQQKLVDGEQPDQDPAAR